MYLAVNFLLSIRKWYIYFYFVELGIQFGTSDQFPVGSNAFKRNVSLLSQKPEQIVDLSENWKSKGKVNDKLTTLNTYERIYESASNIDRNP